MESHGKQRGISVYEKQSVSGIKSSTTDFRNSICLEV